MKPMKLSQIADMTGGTFFGADGLLDNEVDNIVIDSRKVNAASLFIPITGEKFDGHDFIDAAFDAGAVCVLSEKPLEGDLPYILVPDALEAFQAIAREYRSLFGLHMVGITGSVGKTTTKEIIASVLQQQYEVLKTEGNLNNQTGVPQNLLRLRSRHEVAVLELGTNHFGEIRALSKMVQPDICVFTNIGDAHIEFFQSREGILRAKSEMLEYMPPDGTVILNGDDEQLIKLKQDYPKAITYGLQESNDYYAKDIELDGLSGSRFTACFADGEVRLFVPSPGLHMIQNALAAIAVGRLLELPLEQISAGVEGYEPLSGRMCIEKTCNLLILNDVYNANPGSMRSALDVLKSSTDGRTVCILGDMFELGDQAPEYHKQVGAYAAQVGIDCMLFVGKLSRHMLKGAKGSNATHYDTVEELIDALPTVILPGDTVLVKASRGMALERVVAELEHL